MTAPAASRLGGRRALVGGAVTAVLLIAVALLAGGGSSSGGALSPTSTAPDGLRGLVLLIQQFGGTVRTATAVPPDDEHVALLARDQLDDATRQRVEDWVDRGGTLVVADPSSPFASASRGVAPPLPDRGACTIDELSDVATIDVRGPNTTDLGPSGAVRETVGRRDQSCFGDERSAFVVSSPRGRGRIIALGSANPFVNGRLDREDNSVFALRLLQPGGASTITFVQGGAGGTTTLLDLVPDRVVQAIVQVGIAFVLYALVRARRLGRPVREPQQVSIPGSRMVSAVGELQARSHASERAAHAVRADVRRTIGQRYGLPVQTPVTTVAETVAARTGLDAARVQRALDDTPVLDDDELVAVSHELDTIRTEVFNGSRR